MRNSKTIQMKKDQEEYASFHNIINQNKQTYYGVGQYAADRRIPVQINSAQRQPDGPNMVQLRAPQLEEYQTPMFEFKPYKYADLNGSQQSKTHRLNENQKPFSIRNHMVLFSQDLLQFKQIQQYNQLTTYEDLILLLPRLFRAPQLLQYHNVVRHFFNEVDSDKDGYLNKHQIDQFQFKLLNATEYLIKKYNKVAEQPINFTIFFERNESKLVKSQLSYIFDQFDVYNDGQVYEYKYREMQSFLNFVIYKYGAAVQNGQRVQQQKPKCENKFTDLSYLSVVSNSSTITSGSRLQSARVGSAHGGPVVEVPYQIESRSQEFPTKKEETAKNDKSQNSDEDFDTLKTDDQQVEDHSKLIATSYFQNIPPEFKLKTKESQVLPGLQPKNQNHVGTYKADIVKRTKSELQIFASALLDLVEPKATIDLQREKCYDKIMQLTSGETVYTLDYVLMLPEFREKDSSVKLAFKRCRLASSNIIAQAQMDEFRGMVSRICQAESARIKEQQELGALQLNRTLEFSQLKKDLAKRAANQPLRRNRLLDAELAKVSQRLEEEIPAAVKVAHQQKLAAVKNAEIPVKTATFQPEDRMLHQLHQSTPTKISGFIASVQDKEQMKRQGIISQVAQLRAQEAREMFGEGDQ